ncbi:MAG TPA: hypothetical protein DDW50_04715 [Firmicutes bacterium]|nr:hypothetical protein [Bacillota bacterium]
MWDDILKPIILWAITAILTFIVSEIIWKRYFKTHPKIYCEIKHGIHSTYFDGRNFERVRCEYNFIVVFKNNSCYDTYNLSIIWPNDIKLLDVNLERNNFIKAHDMKITESKYVVVIDKSLADTFKHQLNKYRPPELQKMRFNLQYENAYGRKFITQVFWNNPIGHNEVDNKFPFRSSKKRYYNGGET